MKEALNRSYAHHEEDDKETRLNKLKALIRMGKERGYLTYSEVNDHMPENIVDPDQIDQIISTLADLGIQSMNRLRPPTICLSATLFRQPVTTLLKKKQKPLWLPLTANSVVRLILSECT